MAKRPKHHSILVEQPGPMPPIHKMGRPKNSGSRIQLVLQMKVGVPVYGFTWMEKNSTYNAARKLGIQLKTVRIPDTDRYAIERLT